MVKLKLVDKLVDWSIRILGDSEGAAGIRIDIDMGTIPGTGTDVGAGNGGIGADRILF